jgi:6-pyruvoyltetrahydropterin/6-carboxytetrahydropterin synthase
MATELADTQTDRVALSPEGHVFEITKSVTFEAAHFIGTQPEGHRYGNIHGHSFELQVTVSGRVAPGKMWVEDFAVVTDTLQQTAAKLDHQLLNEIEGLDVPTLENICLWAARDLSANLTGLARVSIARPSLNERCELVL